MLMSRNWNCSEITASNTSERASHQYSVSTAIERWDLVYWEVGKNKVISECGLSGIS